MYIGKAEVEIYFTCTGDALGYENAGLSEYEFGTVVGDTCLKLILKIHATYLNVFQFSANHVIFIFSRKKTFCFQ